MPTSDAERDNVACRYCGAPSTLIIERRGTRVLRRCPVCKLSWLDDEPPPQPER